MDPTTIVMIVIMFILLYIIYYYYLSNPSMLMKNITSAQTTTTISASSIPSASNGSVNFSYSIWFNINDWNYGYGNPKPLFRRASTTTSYTPNVYFDSMQNNLLIAMNVGSSTTDKVQICTIPNIPIQKWVHLFISVYGRSLDTYINGKLVQTCILNGVPVVDTKKDIVVTPSPGFNGWTTQFQYWADATDPQSVWNLYKAGNGQGIFSSMFGNYGLKVALLNSGNEQNSFTI